MQRLLKWVLALASVLLIPVAVFGHDMSEAGKLASVESGNLRYP